MICQSGTAIRMDGVKVGEILYQKAEHSSVE
jgi:hypothetical protein